MTERLDFQLSGDNAELVRVLEELPAVIESIARQVNARAETIDVGSTAEQSIADLASVLDGLNSEIQGVASRASQMGQRLEDAGREGSIATGQVADSMGRVQRAAREISQDTGLDEIAPDARRAAEGLAEVSEELARAQRIEESLSDTTRIRAASGTEAARRLQAATRAVADQVRQLGDDADISAAALEELGESPTEFLSEAENEFEQTLVLLARLRISLRKMEEESTEGLDSFADQSVKARVSFGQLEELLERAGDKVAPELRREVDRLGGQIDETFERGSRRVADFERQARQTERQVRRLDFRSASLFDLEDALQDLIDGYPKLSRVAGETAFVVGGSIVVYNLTRKAIEAVNDATGINIDLLVQQGLEQGKALELTKRLLGIEIDLEAEERRIANQRNILVKRGIEFVDTLEGIEAAYEELSRTFRQGHADRQDVERFLDELRGFEVSEVERQTERLARNLARLGDELRADPELIAEVNKRLSELEEKARRAGDEVSGETVAALEQMQRELEFVGDGLAEVSEGVKASLLEDTPEAIRASLEALVEYSRQVSTTSDGTVDLGRVTEEQAERIVSEIDRLRERIKLLPADQRDAVSGASEELERLEGVYASLTEAAGQQLDAIKEKTVTAFRGLAETLTDLIRSTAASLPETDVEVGVTADPEQIRQQIGQLQGELDRLGGAGGIFADPETAERAREIEATIRGLGQELAAVERGAVDAFDPQPAQDFQAAIVGLVKDNEAFRSGYESLGESGQTAIRSILTEYTDLARSQGVSRDLLEGFGRRIKTVFSESGAPVRELGLVLDELAGKAPTVADAFAVLEEQGATESLDRLNDRLRTNRDLQESLATQATATGKAVEQDLTEPLVEMGRQGSDATEAAARGMDRLARRTAEVERQASGVLSVIGELRSQATATVEAVRETAIITDQIPPDEAELGRLRELVELLGPLAEGLERLGSDAIGAGLETRASQLDALVDRLGAVETAAQSVLDLLRGIRDVEVA